MRPWLACACFALLVSAIAGCPNEEVQPPETPRAPPSKPGACAAASCGECVGERGCSFNYASGMCLTPEQAEVCSEATCATSAAECAAKKL